jgi:hypothetical protein
VASNSFSFFANFTFTGVRPVHVFAAVADAHGQLEWNPSMTDEKLLVDDPSRMARGMKLQYGADPFPDRKVYEWEVFDYDTARQDFWFATTSQDNKAIEDMDTGPEDSGFLGLKKPVTADSCFSAHHIRATPDGQGVYGVFTTHLNGHPPFGLSPGFVSHLTWGKTVDFVKALRKRAEALAAQDQAALKLPPANLVAPQTTPYVRPNNCALPTSPLIGQTILRQEVGSNVPNMQPLPVVEPPIAVPHNSVSWLVALLVASSTGLTVACFARFYWRRHAISETMRCARLVTDDESVDESLDE